MDQQPPTPNAAREIPTIVLRPVRLTGEMLLLAQRTRHQLEMQQNQAEEEKERKREQFGPQLN